MEKLAWQLQSPMDAVLFDCDGTLSTIEGIDELAKMNGVGQTVEAMTADAMNRTGINVDLYDARLQLVKPSYKQVSELAQHYFTHKVQDLLSVLEIFAKLKKAVYIISAGVNPAVSAFGKLLNIPQENVFAVDLKFDAEGNYQDFDRESPMTNRQGKKIIVADIIKTHPNVAYVGDGANDLVVLDYVKRFIGYGGSFYRENIAKHSDYYICTPSMSPLLPLILTQEEAAKLTAEEHSTYSRGLTLLTNGTVVTGSRAL